MNQHTLTVSELNKQIKNLVQSGFSRIIVKGEISELNILISNQKELDYNNKQLYDDIDLEKQKHKTSILNMREEQNKFNLKLNVTKGEVLSQELQIKRLNQKIDYLESEVKNLSKEIIKERKNNKLTYCKLNETLNCLEMSREEKDTYAI